MAKADRDQKIGKWMLTYEASLRRYFSRRLSESEADDLVQEVFLKLQTSRSIDNVEGYIFATARNVLISRYREQAAKSHFLHDQWGEWHDVADPLSPERIAIGHEDYQRVVSAIGNLPPRTRQAFQLHRFEHLTYQAIAQQMGISRDSVKELIQRALLRITEALEDER
ncbi:MAG TPA: RNA polymerase sigma factor [Sphingopyxis sp.]|nr:RNA polymerase sigma factor [Sphingopyxis sp.]